VECQQGDIGHFDHFKTNSRNVTNGMTFTPKACHQDFIVLLQDRKQKREKICDLLAVLDELNSHTLPDGRIGLLSLHTSAEGRSTALFRVSLQGSAQMGLLILFIMPFLLTAVITELPGCTQTTTLSWKTKTNRM
uniref:Uncharacterized protein n=1 Tax=Monopterus albus TaxID=43700 RepID=A0A3Q3KEY1_MONAL